MPTTALGWASAPNNSSAYSASSSRWHSRRSAFAFRTPSCQVATPWVGVQGSPRSTSVTSAARAMASVRAEEGAADVFGDGGGALVGGVIGGLAAVGGVDRAEQAVAARSPQRARAQAAARGGVMPPVITGFAEVTSGPGRMGYGLPVPSGERIARWPAIRAPGAPCWSRGSRAVPGGVGGVLLPDAGLVPRGRGPGAGDDAARLEGPGPVRPHPCLGADLVVPDRD